MHQKNEGELKELMTRSSVFIVVPERLPYLRKTLNARPRKRKRASVVRIATTNGIPTG